MSFADFQLGYAAGVSHAQVRAITVAQNVTTANGPLMTLGTYNLLAPVVAAKTGGWASASVSADRVISTSGGLANGAAQTVSGTLTGADGCILPWSATLTGDGSIAGISTAALPEFRDDFTTAGNLNGRSGWEVRYRPGFSGQINNITAASGYAGGTAGSAVFALATASVTTPRVEIRLGLNSYASPGFVAHANIDQVTDANRAYLIVSIAPGTISNVPTGSTYLRKVVSGGVDSIVQQAGSCRPEAGDVLRQDYYTSGADTMLQLALNGRPFGAPIVVTAATTGVALTKKFGFVGNLGAATADSIQIVDRATQHSIGLYAPNRIVALNLADGSATWALSGDYAGTTPTVIYAVLYDLSSGTPVVVPGFEGDGLAISGLVASGGAWSGTITASAAQIAGAGPYSVEVRKVAATLGDGSKIFARAEGPRQWPGYVFVVNGQSLGVQSMTQGTAADIITSPASLPAPAHCFVVNGQPSNVSTAGNAYDKRQLPLGDTVKPAAFATAIHAITGRPCTIVQGGMSGTAIALRNVGTATHTAMIDGIRHAGSRVTAYLHTDGQSDINTASASYVADLQAYYDNLDALFGAAPVLLNPVATCWATTGITDVAWQAMRRLHWQLTQDYPARYLPGANVLDVQHLDNLHLSLNGYAEFNRRMGWAWAKAVGLAAADRSGPSLASVARIDAQTVRCVYDLNGADSLSLLNTGVHSEFHGGMRFGTATTSNGVTLTASVWPTAATVDVSPSGGQQGINFSFATGSFPGTVYAWAGWGRDPHNPFDLTDVQADMAGKASMIVGVRAGENNVGLRPHYGASVDWLSAS